MRDKLDYYLKNLDKILENIPKKDKVLLKEMIYHSYGLIHSKNVVEDIQYLDYLFCHLLNHKYINYSTFLDLGKNLEDIIYALKVRDNF